MRSALTATVSAMAVLSIAVFAQAPAQQANPAAPAPEGRGGRGGGRGQAVPNPAHSRIKRSATLSGIGLAVPSPGTRPAPGWSSSQAYSPLTTSMLEYF